MIGSSKSAQEFKAKVETKTSEDRMARSDDGISSLTDTSDEQSEDYKALYNNLMSQFASSTDYAEIDRLQAELYRLEDAHPELVPNFRI